MVDFENITLDTKNITTRGDRKIVEMEATYPIATSMGIMRRAVKTRARARALISAGVVNTTVSNVKGMEIQRFTRVESIDTIDRDGRTETQKIIVIVES